MLCYCWMTRRQVRERERNRVEKESGAWEANEKTQFGHASATFSRTLRDSDYFSVNEPGL